MGKLSELPQTPARAKSSRLYFRRELARVGVRSVSDRHELGKLTLPDHRMNIFSDDCAGLGCSRCGQQATMARAAADRDDALLNAIGWTVLRFPGCLVEADPARCARDVAAALACRRTSGTLRGPARTGTG